MFEPWLTRWALVPDGVPNITLGSRLLPVRMGDVPAMLKIAFDAEENSTTFWRMTMPWRPKVSCKSRNSRLPCSMPDRSKGFRKACYSECLTRDGSYVVYCGLDPMRNLASSTEAQEVLQDHGRSTISKDSLPTGSRQWSWEKPASAGFFSSVENVANYLWKRRIVNGLHQSAGMSSVYASPIHLFWIHQLSRWMHSGSRMIDHKPGWLLTGCRNGLEKPA